MWQGGNTQAYSPIVTIPANIATKQGGKDLRREAQAVADECNNPGQHC
jgi:hypothetical protein